MHYFKIAGFLAVSGLGIGAVLFEFANLATPVTFASLESVTNKGHTVFNQVQLLSGVDKDVWLMRQSHRGLTPDKQNWDRLAIIIDKSTTPTSTLFYQFTPGDLSLGTQTKPYKVRCFACHANGPRVIHPSNKKLKLNWRDQFQIFAWNLKIKMYGRLISSPGQEVNQVSQFKANAQALSQPLGLQACVKCHSDHGIRSKLLLEHAGTANFLVKEGFMPPFPFRISEMDRAQLERLNGIPLH